MANIIIIGGGVIGLCSAYYLNQNGHNVTVIDKTDMLDSCSYGNAGYVCPSHFVPLASPGIVKQGLKWMTSTKSPFYIHPALNMNLIKWGYHFVRSSTKKHVTSSAIPLRDIALLSIKLYEELNRQEGFNFYFEKKGLLEFFKTEKTMHHEAEMVSKAKSLGIDAKQIGRNEAAEMEPGIDRKSTRLNSSHLGISYAVFCLKNIRSSTSRRSPLATQPPGSCSGSTHTH